MVDGAQSFDSEPGALQVNIMRDEFVSCAFLAVAVAGIALLCSGLLALTFV
jgi:hypothetical protein